VHTPAQLAELTASDGASGDQLGYSVALSSDASTIVAGAVNATVNGNVAQGVVYVFTKPPGGWANGQQTAKLTASDGAAHHWLGVSVAISGSTIVAGSDPIFGSAVYVFTEPATGWVDGQQTAKLTHSVSEGALGYRVAAHQRSPGAQSSRPDRGRCTCSPSRRVAG
jgi:hypothetical protein